MGAVFVRVISCDSYYVLRPAGYEILLYFSYNRVGEVKRVLFEIVVFVYISSSSYMYRPYPHPHI